MSTSVEEGAPATEVVVVRVKPNAHRLSRIFRNKATEHPPPAWRRAEDGEHRIGVTLEEVRRLVEQLTEEERKRAAAGLDPLSPIQEELSRRAARFGLALQTPGEPVKTVHIDEEVLARRAARFETAATNKEALDSRVARFGGATTTAVPSIDVSALSEEARATLEARSPPFWPLKLKNRFILLEKTTTTPTTTFVK